MGGPGSGRRKGSGARYADIRNTGWGSKYNNWANGMNKRFGARKVRRAIARRMVTGKKGFTDFFGGKH